MPDLVDEDDGFSSPYHPSYAGTPNHSMRHIRRSTNPSISTERQKIDGEVEDQTEDDLMLRSSSPTGSKKLQQFYGLPYFQNLKAFNALDDDCGDSNDFEAFESQRGPNGYGYAQIKSEPEELDNRVALDQVLAENRSLSAEITELRAQNRILLDIIQRTGDIFSDITHMSKRLDAPAKFRDTLNTYFLENGVEESQAD
ncbi:hypothetical protein FB446DRAFT_707628 [Lentinula raphanica]|nr:hypothetical protein FB446DRAFT_707628 [Lentinula raphanica]